MAKTSVKALPLVVYNTAGILPAYGAGINAPGFAQAIFFLRIVNASNIAITLSYDSINDNEIILANSVFELPVQQNAQPAAMEALFSKFTQLYVRAPGAGVGNLYISGYYV